MRAVSLILLLAACGGSSADGGPTVTTINCGIHPGMHGTLIVQ